MQKKNLIAYISDLAGVFNVYPEQSSMIDFNSIMRAAGEIYVNKIMNTCSLTIVMNSLIQESSLPKITAFLVLIPIAHFHHFLTKLPILQKPFSVKFFTFDKLIFNQSTSSSPKQTNGHTRNRSLSNLGKSPANPSQTPLSHKRTNSSFFKSTQKVLF